MTAAQAVLSIAQHHRRWDDLSGVRLAVGLVTAPAIAVLSGGLVDFALARLTAPSEPMQYSLQDLEFAATILFWWVLIVGGYPTLVTRRKKRIARRECLLLGLATAAAAPLPLALPWSIIYRAPYIGIGPAVNYVLADMRSDVVFTVAFIALLTLFLAPFGLFGGWFFWRVGVRPAVTPTAALGPIFD